MKELKELKELDEAMSKLVSSMLSQMPSELKELCKENEIARAICLIEMSRGLTRKMLDLWGADKKSETK